MRGRSFLLEVPSARPFRTTGQAVLAAKPAAAEADLKKCRLEWRSGCISVPSRVLVRFQVSVTDSESVVSRTTHRTILTNSCMKQR